MKALIACALLVVASAQLFHQPWWNGVAHDRHDGYVFEYHNRHDLVVVRDRKHCYLINAGKKLHYSATQRTSVEDDIIKHIKAKDGLHKETFIQALHQFHDILAVGECRNRKLFELDFKLPAMMTANTDAPTTMAAPTTM